MIRVQLHSGAAVRGDFHRDASGFGSPPAFPASTNTRGSSRRDDSSRERFVSALQPHRRIYFRCFAHDALRILANRTEQEFNIAGWALTGEWREMHGDKSDRSQA